MAKKPPKPGAKLQKGLEKHHRSKYVSNSLQFVDWINQLGFEKTLFGRIVLALDERFHLRQMASVFLFCFVLSFLMFFNFELPNDFRIGEVAKKDLKSPLTFEIVDEIATEKKRIEAENAVPPVFDYNPDAFDGISSHIYDSFRVMRGHIRKVKWPRNIYQREEKIKDFFRYKPEFEKLIGYDVPDLIFEWLVDKKFSVRIENILIRAHEKWYDSKIADTPETLIPKGQEQVIFRVLRPKSQGQEFAIAKKEIVDLSKKKNFTLKDVNGINGLKSKDKKNLLKLSHIMLVPNATLNQQETTSRRQKARESVLPVVLSLKKNQAIISKGSIVQPVHMMLLREIQLLNSNRNHDFLSLVSAILFLLFLMVCFSYVRKLNKQKLPMESKDLVVMGTVILFSVAMTKIFLFFTDAALVSKLEYLVPANAFLYLAPVAAGPMLVGLLIPSGYVVWVFTLFLSIILSIMVDLNFPFFIVTLVGGIAAARGVMECSKRNDIYFAGLRTGMINALMVGLVLTLSGINREGLGSELLWSIPAGFFSGIFSSFVAMMFVPLLESVFNYTTDVRLLELCNLNHPLLRDLLVKAPGTYHHSMMVGNLAEAAARAIGAKPLQSKVMGYYHDIGKMEHSQYFIENQKPGTNPHDDISPYMSKTILVAHVKDGVEMGMKYKLGTPIIDGILQHHGTTVISYFYNKAMELNTDEHHQVSEDDFRYPGPKPQFRESGLLMLADSVEAAARALDEPTAIRIQNLVKNIIQKRFSEGQLEECNLTLRDLSLIEEVFERVLLGIYHQRIDYPKKAGGVNADKDEGVLNLDIDKKRSTSGQ